MKSHFTPTVGPFDSYSGDEYYGSVSEDSSPFHVGQSYEQVPAVRLCCKGCGGLHFSVAQGDYFTAIRCETCAWEARIHEG